MALDDLLSEIRSTTPNALGAHNSANGEVVDDGNDAERQQVGQEISHDLFLEQGTPGDIAAATQQDQGENHLAEGQQDDSTKADQSDLLNHGLTFVSHLVPLDPGHCDSEAVDHFLRGIGFGCNGLYPLANATLLCLSANSSPLERVLSWWRLSEACPL